MAMMAIQHSSHKTLLYIFVGLRDEIQKVLKLALTQRREQQPHEKWGLLVNETGLLSSDDLSGVEWRELFGCACCTGANSPVLRTAIISLLRTKPSKVLLILSVNSEPEKLIPMIDQYFARAAPLSRIIICTNQTCHNDNMREDTAYQSQFEISDVVIGMDQNITSMVSPSKIKFLTNWTSFEDIDSLDKLPFPDGYSKVDEEEDTWNCCQHILSAFHTISHVRIDPPHTSSVALSWAIPSNMKFVASQVEGTLRNIALNTCEMASDISPHLLQVSLCAVLSSNEGGWKLYTAHATCNTGDIGGMSFKYSNSVSRQYSHRNYSLVEIEIIWKDETANSEVGLVSEIEVMRLKETDIELHLFNAIAT